MASAGRMLYREGKHAGHFYSRQAKGGCRLKINILFLLIGLVLSIISKMAQAAGKSKIGEVVVVPAAVFFCPGRSFFHPQIYGIVEPGERRAGSGPDRVLNLPGGCVVPDHDDPVCRARQIVWTVPAHSVGDQCGDGHLQMDDNGIVMRIGNTLQDRRSSSRRHVAPQVLGTFERTAPVTRTNRRPAATPAAGGLRRPLSCRAARNRERRTGKRARPGRHTSRGNGHAE